MSDSAGGDSKSLAEWTEARSILARYDGYLNDLRKFSFPFITGLLALSGFLGSTTITNTNQIVFTGNSNAISSNATFLNSTISGNALTNGTFSNTTTIAIAKATVPTSIIAIVLIVIMGLIVAVTFLDTLYRRFQRAATIRARLLENRLNLDITNDIAILHSKGHWIKYANYMYYLLLLLASSLGIVLCWPNYYEVGGLVFAFIVFVIAIRLVASEREKMPFGDWSVDKKVLTQGDSLRITFTNLNYKEDAKPEDAKKPKDKQKKPGIFDLDWEITSPENKKLPTYSSDKKPGLELRYFDDYNWIWKANADIGIYKLTMHWKDRTQNDDRNDTTSPATPVAGKLVLIQESIAITQGEASEIWIQVV
ncbi:MAG: hypothetical protein ABSF36_08920 [Candidatus Methanomethylicaceae archaeon]